jgi:hypothetical protein
MAPPPRERRLHRVPAPDSVNAKSEQARNFLARRGNGAPFARSDGADAPMHGLWNPNMASANSPLLFVISEPVGSALANHVADRLAGHDVRAWIGSLAPGGELNETAMNALRSSAGTLLIFDRAAAQSRDVDRHLLVARQTGKPLIPLRVEPTDEGMLRQELLDARWIDWSAGEAALAEISRRAHQYAQPGDARGPGVAAAAGASASGAQEPRKPRIEVLGAGAAAASAGYAAPPATAPSAPAPSAPVAERSSTMMVETRRRSPFASPTVLLALLAVLAIFGAILYNSGLFSGGGDGDEREVAQRTETETTTATTPPPLEETSSGPVPVSEAPWGPATEGTEESLPPEPAAPAPVAVPLPAPRGAPAAPAPDVARVPPSAPDSPRAPAAAAADAPAPSNQPAAASDAAATVRSFYSALSGGNGAAAAQLVIPAKRGSGPLSAGSLSRYYSSFRRPLRVRSVTPVDADTVRVAYDYVLSDGRLCEGQASVNVVQSGGRSLVSGIRTRGPC